MIDEHSPWRAYGRGVYNYDSGSNVTLFEDDSLVLVYTGSRWFFSVFEDGKLMTWEYWLRYSREVHAFWDRLYQDNSKAVSNPTSKSDPIAVDFFFIEERGERYGPLGKLVQRRILRDLDFSSAFRIFRFYIERGVDGASATRKSSAATISAEELGCHDRRL